MTKLETKKLDLLWRKIIVLKAGNKCEYPGCKKDSYLNAHHLYSRSKRSTRWLVENGMCLCSGCHTLNDHSAHKSPDFKDTIINEGVRTREFWEELARKAFTPEKIDFNKTLEYLTNELKKYE